MAPRIYYSSYPSVPLHTRSIFTHLLSVDPNNGKIGGFPAQEKVFVDAATGISISRQDLRTLSLKFGYGLRHDPRVKAQRGDVVLVFSPNSLQYPVYILGAIAAGMRCTLTNNAYTARELQHQYIDSGATMIITTSENLSVALEMLIVGLGLSQTDAENRIIISQNSLAWASGLVSSRSEGEATRDLITFDQLLGIGELQNEEEFDGESAQETALLCYSSGTTGQPKTTHQNLTTATETIDLVLGYKAGDRLLIFLPFYHIYGAVSGLLFPIFCGTTTVIMARFDLIDFCVAVERYRITAVLVVPPVMLAIARHPAIDKFDLSSIWLLFSSAAPVSPTLIKEAKKRLLAKRKPEETLYITEGYGMTECSPASHILPLDSSVLKMGSVGVLLPNYQARLVADDSGETEVDAEEGIPGELWLKGPSVMKGYLNNLTANKDSFTTDRWYKTGDICVRDKEGFYFIVDRKKELIKYKVLPPAELESVLITHPEVADAAVIGVHNENDMTELPRAYVVHTQPAKISTSESKKSFEKSVAKWMESKVARHKYLRGGDAAGKILRRELRAMAKREPVQSKL
ncbi:AMP binding protein [Lentinula edodes]|uniref:AMP binding protein n=1 Tax=Lentinula edodes TaxID=5353 RepID=UPI001E8EEE9B|nr:AMP binding protein [Lentinula edodes]KAH7872035.1 AMP binding protein [Lentinula edodes]KAJ3905157.1 AMP binding protein [Lentinula edodes]